MPAIKTKNRIVDALPATLALPTITIEAAVNNWRSWAAGGGREAIVARVWELRREADELEKLIGVAAAFTVRAIAGEITGLRRRHPRLYAKGYQGEGVR